MTDNSPAIGVFGGTFDPVHNAHCDIAYAAMEQAGLDRVIFVVSARPPHKGEGIAASPEERYAMVQAAVAGEPRFQASRIELDRAGPSYTVDTLRQIRKDFPGARLHLIVGWDSLADLPHWRSPEAILNLARLLVVPRPGLARVAPESLEGHYDALAFRETALSSTEVRDRILAGQPFDTLVPPPVASLIRERGIYHVRR